jgi:hypothetical protein
MYLYLFKQGKTSDPFGPSWKVSWVGKCTPPPFLKLFGCLMCVCMVPAHVIGTHLGVAVVPLAPMVQQRRDETILGIYLYCLRIWIPKNTGFYLSHFPETIHTYCIWKVRQVFCIVSDDWSHQKRLFDRQDIWPYWSKKKQTHFFFICKSKYKTMDFLTNQQNTGTHIRLKIKTIQSDTNTCLVSVAPLVALQNLHSILM